MDSDFQVNLTCGQIREYLDGGNDLEELTDVLDNAQGKVHAGEAEKSTILITVKKDPDEDD